MDLNSRRIDGEGGLFLYFYQMLNLLKHSVFALMFIHGVSAIAQDTAIERQGIGYYDMPDDNHAAQQCVLDVYFPTDKENFTTIIWFHGGGLTGGTKEIPEYLKKKGLGVVGVGYRLSPKVKVSEIINDAAAAIKWVYNEVENYGGDKKKIVLSGHSAGGYLALMVGMDKSYLGRHGIDADSLLALVPFSAQTVTHFTKRAEDGIPINQPIIDRFAPLYWVRKEAPPIVLITGDRELEMVGRYEENAYLARMLKVVGHADTKLLELDGYDHSMVYPALPLLVKEVERLTNLDNR